MTKIYNYFRTHRKAVLLLVVFLAAGIWFLFGSSKRQQVSGKNSLTIAARTAAEEQIKKLQQDSDGDGLRDWEEVLYHTDPHNPDTDGDGTPDGEEVKFGRDPLKPNTSKNPNEPNDFMATSTPATIQNSAIPDSNLTRRLAAEIGKQMIVRRIAHPDIPFDPQSAGQDIVGNVISSLPDSISASLTEKDIAIGHDNSSAAIKTYKAAIERIAYENFKNLSAKSEATVFAEALDTQNYDKLKALDPYLAAYDRAIGQLKTLPVPPRFAGLHLEYLNLGVARASAVHSMRGAADDPVSALIGAKQYIAIQERFQMLAQKFQSEYRKIGV